MRALRRTHAYTFGCWGQRQRTRVAKIGFIDWYSAMSSSTAVRPTGRGLVDGVLMVTHACHVVPRVHARQPSQLPLTDYLGKDFLITSSLCLGGLCMASCAVKDSISKPRNISGLSKDSALAGLRLPIPCSVSTEGLRICEQYGVACYPRFSVVAALWRGSGSLSGAAMASFSQLQKRRWLSLVPASLRDPRRPAGLRGFWWPSRFDMRRSSAAGCHAFHMDHPGRDGATPEALKSSCISLRRMRWIDFKARDGSIIGSSRRIETNGVFTTFLLRVWHQLQPRDSERFDRESIILRLQGATSLSEILY